MEELEKQTERLPGWDMWFVSFSPPSPCLDSHSCETALLPPLQPEPGDLERDAVQALVHGHVERLALVAAAERHVAGDADRLLSPRLRQARGDERDLLTLGVDDLHTGPAQPALGQVDVPHLVHAHAVAAGLSS